MRVVQLFLRTRGGQSLWLFATGAVPSLSLLAGEPLWIAASLFWCETVLASALIGGRVGFEWWRTGRRGDRARQSQLGEIGRLLGLLVGTFNVALGIIGGFILVAGSRNGAFELHESALFLDRLRMLVLALLAAAAYDTLFAPTQALRWLQSVAAWQWSRTAVLFVGLAFAGAVGLVAGERGALWGFLVLRVTADAGALRATERERITTQVFGDPSP